MKFKYMIYYRDLLLLPIARLLCWGQVAKCSAIMCVLVVMQSPINQTVHPLSVCIEDWASNLISTPAHPPTFLFLLFPPFSHTSSLQ